MTAIATLIGYVVMVMGAFIIVVFAWKMILEFVYRYVVFTEDFYKVLVRYKQEQAVSKELAERRKAEEFMGRPK